MANISMNQFGQQVVKGMVDLRNGQAPLSCIVDATSTLGASTGILAGTPVKIVPSTLRGVPKVVECATDAEDIFGFVVYDVKSVSFKAGDRLEVLPFRNGIMYMEANAAIAQNAEIAILVAGYKVITATSTDRIVGRALDASTGAGKLIRVVIDLPGLIKA